MALLQNPLSYNFALVLSYAARDFATSSKHSRALPKLAWYPAPACLHENNISDIFSLLRYSVCLPIVMNKGNSATRQLEIFTFDSYSTFSRWPESGSFLDQQLSQFFDQDFGIPVRGDRCWDEIRSHGDTPFHYVCCLRWNWMCCPVIGRLESTQDDISACPRDRVLSKMEKTISRPRLSGIKGQYSQVQSPADELRVTPCLYQGARTSKT